MFLFCGILGLKYSNYHHMQRFFASFVSGVRQAYDKLFPNVLKKRTWWPVFLVGIFLISIVSVTLVFAAIDFTTVFGWVGRILASILLELAKLCIFLAIFFLRFFITLASYNNYIDVSVVRLGWVMVRDVANMFFIVGLLVIAFATILGLEGYEWKRGLVKIVLMAILINFSNLIAQLVIDVAHIFTITFLNAVSATAGGNLINLFQFDKILGLVSGDALGTTPENASLALFAASVMSFLFALLAALTIGAYLVTMIARIVVLWALIILSPLAFMLYALPKGEDYAREWWSEFTKHVIVAPIMVFFLWLAFATFGTGQIISEIQSGPNVIKIDATGENAQFQQSVSILEITTWENMASFLLGIAFLWVGIKKTQDTGATGSGLIGGAVDFTKKVATIATGYAAGRWLVGNVAEKTYEGVKANAPIIGTKSLARKGQFIKGAASTIAKKIPVVGSIARDTMIQDWEKKGKDAKGLSKIGWKLLRGTVGEVMASEKKKDAAAGTWEELAKFADEEHEARISNSGLLGGSLKDEQRIRTQVAVELKEAKGAQKGAEGLMNLMEDEQVSSDLKKTAETKILGENAQGFVEAKDKERYLRGKDSINDKVESNIQKSLNLEEQRRKKEGLSALTDQEKDLFIQEQINTLAGTDKNFKYAKIKKEARVLDVRNEKHEEAIRDEEENKRYQERLRQLKTKEEQGKGRYQDFDDRATRASLQLASGKNVFDLEAQKGANTEFEKLMAENEKFKAEQDAQALLGAEIQAQEDKKNALKEQMLLKEILGLLERGGFGESIAAKVQLEADKMLVDADRELQFITARGGVDYGAALKKTAQLENQKEEVELKKIQKLGDERAAYYDDPKLGDNKARAMAIRQQTAAQILKKEAELFSNLSFNERRALEEQLIQEVAEARVNNVPQNKIRELQRRQLALANTNIASDAETSIAARQRAALASGFDRIDDTNRLAVELSRLTGVQSNNVQELLQAFEGMFDNVEQRNQMMRTLVTSYKSAAGKGDEGGIGLIREDVKDGKVEYVWETDPQKIKESMTYFAATSRMEGGVEGYARQTFDKDAKSWEIDGFDGRGSDSFVQAMTGKDSRAFASANMQRLHEQMKRAKVDQKNVESYINTLVAAKANMGNGGFEASKRVWSDLYSKIQKEVQARGSSYLKSLYNDLMDIQ